MNRNKKNLLLLLSICSLPLLAANYAGRVVDEAGQPLMYASLYLLDNPQIGTTTDADGFFTLDTESSHSTLVVSSLGYETQQFPISHFATGEPIVQLKEQPIWIAPTLVKGKKTPTSKRKKNASYIHAVCQRLEEEWPKAPVKYDVVSDVKLEMNSSTLVMEQLICKVVQIPNADYTKEDSVQFVGTSCKRYCKPSWRKHMDSLLCLDDTLKGFQLALVLDSSMIIHYMLWSFSSFDKSTMRDWGEDLGHWKTCNPDDQHMVLTYKRSQSFFLTLITQYSLLVDNSASLEKSSMDAEIKLFLPISLPLNFIDTTWSEIVSLSGTPMDDFRVKKGNVTAHFETKYQLRDGVRVPSEIIVQAKGQIADRTGKMVTMKITAKQKITAVQTHDVQPFNPYENYQIIGRKEVPMY